MGKAMMFCRIEGTLCRVIKYGIMYLFFPVKSVEEGCVATSRQGWRLTRQFGLEEIPDLEDPWNPTQREHEEALRQFGGRVPFDREKEA